MEHRCSIVRFKFSFQNENQSKKENLSKKENQSKKSDKNKPGKESAISSMGARLFGKSSGSKLRASKSVSETVLNTKPSNHLPSSKSSSQIIVEAKPELLSQLPPTASGSKTPRGMLDCKYEEQKRSSALSQSGNTSLMRKKVRLLD